MYPRFGYSQDKIQNETNILKELHNALSNKDAQAFQELWFNNPCITEWFEKKHILGQKTAMKAIISTQTLIACFHLALVSKNSQLIKEMWALNNELKAWYTRAIDKKHSYKNISHEAFHRDFNLLLHCNCPEILEILWNSHNFPSSWFKGKPINFSDSNQKDIRTIPDVEVIQCFRGMLTTRHTKGVEHLWSIHKKLLLKHYQKHTFTQPIAIDDFKTAVANGHTPIAQMLWQNNISVRSWFSGIPYSFGTMPSEVQFASFKEASFLFSAVIKLKQDEFALELWDSNPSLRNWYSGVNINTENQTSCTAAELISFLSFVEEHKSPRTAQAIKDGNDLWEHAKKIPGIEREAKMFREKNTISLFASPKEALQVDYCPLFLCTSFSIGGA